MTEGAREENGELGGDTVAGLRQKPGHPAFLHFSDSGTIVYIQRDMGGER